MVYRPERGAGTTSSSDGSIDNDSWQAVVNLRYGGTPSEAPMQNDRKGHRWFAEFIGHHAVDRARLSPE